MKRRSFLAWLGLAPAAGWLGAKLLKDPLPKTISTAPMTLDYVDDLPGESVVETFRRKHEEHQRLHREYVEGHITFFKDENGELVPPDISAEIARVAKARGVKL